MSEVKILQGAVEAAQRSLGVIEVGVGGSRFKLPLKSVDLLARVADRLTHVTVKQAFTNPYSEHLEAVYIFPLSGGCAVSSFEMRVADRVIKGEVQERAAARAQYNTAMQEGKRAALLEQERDDVFTVQVGNLPPGEEVTVMVTYSEKLPYFEDGTTELRLPLVVAPRFVAGSPLERDNVGDGTALDTDVVPDASRISPPRLAPGAKSTPALQIKVLLSGSQSLEDLCCSQHVTKMGTVADGVTISLAREGELLDRDFVLRWRVATDSVQSKFLLYKNSQAKSDHNWYGMLSLVPPKCTEVVVAPRDVIFVVDRSGSMSGIKMVSASRACSYLLSTLSPRDKFAVQAFDTSFDWMPTNSKDNFMTADEGGIHDGIKYLRTITARGGTDLDGALREAISAMKKRQQNTGRQPVVVVLTDGEIANESAIMANLQRQLGDLRVFTVGIDTAVHGGFLQRLAAIGGGTASFVQPGTELESALSQVSREIGTPLIEKLSIEDINSGFQSNTLAPVKIPDLFEGRAVSIFFQLSSGDLKGSAGPKLRVHGQFLDGTIFQQELVAQPTDVEALPQLWAKEHIIDLEDNFRIANLPAEKTKLHDQIVAIAIEHSLLTKFTAFVVVDESEVVNADGSRRKIVQPVENPALWQQAEPLGAAAGGMMPMSAPVWGSPPPSPSSQPSGFQSQPQSWGFGGDSYGAGAGSYGSGVRAQVFEVIVRQGIAGAPWREICAGPMQVNNIDPAEVQAEMDRRVVLMLGGTMLDGQGVIAKPKAPPALNIPEVKKCLEQLRKVLQECFEKLLAGEKPEVDALEKARLDLIGALAQSSVAGSVPQLQKFLRSDLIKLIAAISGANSVNKLLQNLSLQQQKIFESFQPEVAAVLEESAEEPFWQTTV